MIKYFAYGSNLHPVRLQQRIPSSEVVCVTSLAGYRLCFHKRSNDGSAKCNALYTGNDSDTVLGVIYRMAHSEKPMLDAIEGVGAGYRVTQLELQVEQDRHEVFTYLAEESHIDHSIPPYSWYKELVVQGARYHGMAETYINSIDAEHAVDDKEQNRLEENERLLQVMRESMSE